MELNKNLESLKKEYNERAKYQQKIIEELEKVNKEILKIEGAIIFCNTLLEEENRNKQESKKKDTKKE